LLILLSTLFCTLYALTTTICPNPTDSPTIACPVTATGEPGCLSGTRCCATNGLCPTSSCVTSFYAKNDALANCAGPCLEALECALHPKVNADCTTNNPQAPHCFGAVHCKNPADVFCHGFLEGTLCLQDGQSNGNFKICQRGCTFVTNSTYEFTYSIRTKPGTPFYATGAYGKFLILSNEVYGETFGLNNGYSGDVVVPFEWELTNSGHTYYYQGAQIFTIKCTGPGNTCNIFIRNLNSWFVSDDNFIPNGVAFKKQVWLDKQMVVPAPYCYPSNQVV